MPKPMIRWRKSGLATNLGVILKVQKGTADPFLDQT